MIQIGHGVVIPDQELEFSASRSSGPGGQHVNKTSTRVTIRFDVAGSSVLSEDQKRRILSRLASRITGAGVLRVISQKSRSQAMNREAAEERLAELLRQALMPRKARVKTGTPAVSRRNRLEKKRHRSEIKRERSKPDREE